ncbi:DsbA family protein [Methyloceanibacter methanicus]|uniref:DsbA family protein n=1 Tax=Methyloceanibacter methanicus TaxID=1774968 RepID=UPI000AE0A436|nr:DsbA family protein [Methyloceanibacter methanicus]
MAKPDKETTEPTAEAKKSKNGLYVIGAVAVAALAVGIYFFSAETPADPTAPKVDPDMAHLMETGPLDDIVLGDPTAGTVIVEYASMTCPHCAHFYTEVFPQVKEKYIDTGKARFVFREFPLDGLAVAASMLARCAGNDRFYPMLDGLFETQETWAVPGADGKEKLKLIAKQAGFSEDSFEQCLADKELFDKIVAVRKKAHEEYGVDATPSFFVNGKRLPGVGLDVFEAAIDGKPETPPSG